MMHIKDGNISELKLYLTLRVSGIQKKLEANGIFGYLIDLLGNFGNVSGAEFKFGSIKINKYQGISSVLSNLIFTQYKRLFLLQLYQVLGSMDIVGNPLAVARKLGVNTADKIEGDVTFRGELGKIGLNSINALASVASSVSGSVYQFTHYVTMNPIQDEDMPNPHNIKEGLMDGIQGAQDEFFDGILGLFFKPRQVLREQGGSKKALSKGIAKGVLGALAYPANCALSLTYNCSTGMKNATSDSLAQCQRYRYPRYFNQDKLI